MFKIKENDPKPWTVLKSEYLFQRPWLTARRDHVRLPSGVEHPEFYILEYPNWVNVIAITKEKKFVMIRQYRHAIGETAFEMVAGVIDPEDKDPEMAARRELMEETGFGGGEWRLFSKFAPNTSAMTNCSYTYLATDVEYLGERHLEPTEDIVVYELEEAEVRELLETGEIKQALMAAPLWKYFALKK